MSSLDNFFNYRDDYPTCQRTHAALCIYLTDTQSPDSVSGKLGIQPSRTQIKNELRGGKRKHWPTAWFLESSEHVESKDVRRHIDWLLDQLEGKSGMLKELRDADAQIYISCFWTSAAGHGGPMLDPKILKRLSELDLGISFDLYFEGDDTVDEKLRPTIHKA